MIKIKFKNVQAKAPVLFKLRDKSKPQIAFLQLNICSGEVQVDYNRLPWFNKSEILIKEDVRRYEISPYCTGEDIVYFLEAKEVISLFERIIKGAEKALHQTNTKYILNNDAQKAENRLIDLVDDELRDFYPDENPFYNQLIEPNRLVEDLSHYIRHDDGTLKAVSFLFTDQEICASTSEDELKKIAKTIQLDAEADRFVVIGNIFDSLAALCNSCEPS